MERTNIFVAEGMHLRVGSVNSKNFWAEKMTSVLQIDTTTFLTPGDPAPNFIQRSAANPRYAFDSAAGRYLVLCFFGSAADGHAQAALKAALSRPDISNDDRASFFDVSIDPEDEARGRIENRMPGYRHFWDFDLLASRLYGVAARDASPTTGKVALARQWVIIDPTMRVLATIPFRQDQGDLDEVMALLDGLSPPERHAGVTIMAPVLFLPRVFEKRTLAISARAVPITGQAIRPQRRKPHDPSDFGNLSHGEGRH